MTATKPAYVVLNEQLQATLPVMTLTEVEVNCTDLELRDYRHYLLDHDPENGETWDLLGRVNKARSDHQNVEVHLIQMGRVLTFLCLPRSQPEPINP